MPSAEEQWESRTGDVAANRDGFGASREFVVTIDNIGDNPDDVLRDPDETTGVGADAVPFNSPHPTRVGLEAAFFIVQRPRIASLKYRVLIVYAPPIVFAIEGFEWELNYAPGLSSTIVRHDWLGVPIGPMSYSVLGPNQTAPQTFTATVPATSDAPSETLTLARDDGGGADDPVTRPAFLTDVQRTEPVGSFSLTAVFPRMTPFTMASLAMSGNVVNSRPFWDFPAKTVKFIGPVASAGQMILPGGTQGFAFRITLPFEWNALGFRYQAQDVFQTGGLQLPVVHTNGDPVIREWQLYQEADLNTLLALVMRFR